MIKKIINQMLGILFIFGAMCFSGWMYMLIISIFDPISFKNALMVSLIFNIIGLIFNNARGVKNDR